MLSTQESCVCSFNECIFCIKKQRHYFANKGLYSQSYSFYSNHVWMWGLVYKKGWAPKDWCFRTVVLKKTLESPLDCKEIKSVSLKGNQPWIFIGNIFAEAEIPKLWPLGEKSQLSENILMLGKTEDKKRGGWQRMRWLASSTKGTWIWAISRI